MGRIQSKRNTFPRKITQKLSGSELPPISSEALIQFVRNLGISRQALYSTIEDILPVRQDFIDRMNQIESLPRENRKHLENVCNQMAEKLKAITG